MGFFYHRIPNWPVSKVIKKALNYLEKNTYLRTIFFKSSLYIFSYIKPLGTKKSLNTILEWIIDAEPTRKYAKK